MGYPKQAVLFLEEDSSLSELKLGTGFTSSLVKDLNQMFSGCSALSLLDLSSFNTSKVNSFSEMF